MYRHAASLNEAWDHRRKNIISKLVQSYKSSQRPTKLLRYVVRIKLGVILDHLKFSFRLKNCPLYLWAQYNVRTCQFFHLKSQVFWPKDQNKQCQENVSRWLRWRWWDSPDWTQIPTRHVRGRSFLILLVQFRSVKRSSFMHSHLLRAFKFLVLYRLPRRLLQSKPVIALLLQGLQPSRHAAFPLLPCWLVQRDGENWHLPFFVQPLDQLRSIY